MDDNTMPNRSANTSKAEGERWSSDADTVERRERTVRQGESDGGHGEAGITNRPLEEEQENQESLPPRGEARDGANAGHGSLKEEERNR